MAIRGLPQDRGPWAARAGVLAAALLAVLALRGPYRAAALAAAAVGWRAAAQGRRTQEGDGSCAPSPPRSSSRP